jgi:glycosyltransferase involved in cell wall biosynthesis
VVRCLESILKQDYKSVEVIISDDSPDEDIKQVIQPFSAQLNISYFHNQPALGSPKNWNAALDKGKGAYLLLMHQDDWFHAPDALSALLKASVEHNADFVFCQNTAIDEDGKKIILQARPQLLRTMASHPNHLLLAQVIGPPSNTLLKRSVATRYDEKFIWLVDVDYYSRMLKEGYRYHYIERHLVSIGLHEDQTTVFCRLHADIIFKENIWFAGKIGAAAFHDILIFDYYWRLLRNNNIRSIEDIEANNLKREEVPAVILHMLTFQKKIKPELLKNGPLSKSFMSLCYLGLRLNPSRT